MSRGTQIDLSGVSRAYGSAAVTEVALDGVDLHVDPGAFVAVVGPSGSGKSTLLNLLAGLDRPTEGEIVVGSTSLNDLSEAELTAWRGESVGIVFQFFQLLPTLTAVENVMLPMDFRGALRERERLERATSLLERMGVARHARKLPATLSGGQRQRVAIARALANDPSLVLADEPTGNLDSKSSESMLGLFAELSAEGKTVVMVTHERDAGAWASEVVSLRDGAIVPSSSPSAGPAAQASGAARA